MGICRKILYWIVAGIILSMALSSMILTRDGNLLRFYDEGYTENLKEDWIYTVVIRGQYLVQDNKCLSNAEVGMWYSIPWIRITEEAHYLLADIEEWNGVAGSWELHYQDADGNDVQTETFAFGEGITAIPLQEIEYENLLLCLNSTGNMEYRLNSLRITEFDHTLETARLLSGSALCFGAYCIVSLFLYLAVRWKRVFKDLRRKQSGFLGRQADIMLEHLNTPKSRESYASWIRIFLIVSIIVTWKIVHYHYGYTYAVAINLVLFGALLAWIPLEKPAPKRNHLILGIWSAICFLQFISDIAVRKDFEYGEFMEIWMFVCFGLLYRAWTRMKKPYELLEDFSAAVEILFAANILYCLFGDSWKSMVGEMTGIKSNPNPFCMGVACSLVFLLFRLYQAVRQKKKWYYYPGPCVGLAFGVWMLDGAGGRNGWAIFLIAAAFCAVFLGTYALRRAGLGKRIILSVFGALFVIAGIFAALNVWNMVNGGGPAYYYSANSFLSGRVVLWKKYIERIGLLGNSGILLLGAKECAAHNGVISMMYRYGIFAGMLEIVFLLETACAIVRLWKKNAMSEYVFLLLGVYAAYFLTSMLDTCDEGMMGWLCWFAFYFMLGYIMREDRLENDG